MNILKLYSDAETASSGFKDFSGYHKYMGKSNLKRQSFIYTECGTTVYFGYAKDRKDCFGKYSGMKFQMIDFDRYISQEVRDYMLTRLRSSTIIAVDDSHGQDKTVQTEYVLQADGRILITDIRELD